MSVFELDIIVILKRVVRAIIVHLKTKQLRNEQDFKEFSLSDMSNANRVHL